MSGEEEIEALPFLLFRTGIRESVEWVGVISTDSGLGGDDDRGAA